MRIFTYYHIVSSLAVFLRLFMLKMSVLPVPFCAIAVLNCKIGAMMQAAEAHYALVFDPNRSFISDFYGRNGTISCAQPAADAGVFRFKMTCFAHGIIFQSENALTRNIGVFFFIKSPQARFFIAPIIRSICPSATSLVRRTLFLSLKSNMGVQVSGIFTLNFAETERPLLQRICSASFPVCPGVVPYVAANQR